jgi:hypothetical protein
MKCDYQLSEQQDENLNLIRQQYRARPGCTGVQADLFLNWWQTPITSVSAVKAFLKVNIFLQSNSLKYHQ